MRLSPRVDFDDMSRRILKVIQERGIVSGADLMRVTRISSDVLRDKLQPLVDEKLIQPSGNFQESAEIPYAIFHVQPSNAPMVKMLIE
ncbi:MAG: hypothetical protein IAG10_21570 [Planctomycetaceae bacterium]|nr:hypothetical protein [Planctomycetaceae bacterium]